MKKKDYKLDVIALNCVYSPTSNMMYGDDIRAHVRECVSKFINDGIDSLSYGALQLLVDMNILIHIKSDETVSKREGVYMPIEDVETAPPTDLLCDGMPHGPFGVDPVSELHELKSKIKYSYTDNLIPWKYPYESKKNSPHLDVSEGESDGKKYTVVSTVLIPFGVRNQNGRIYEASEFTKKDDDGKTIMDRLEEQIIQGKLGGEFNPYSYRNIMKSVDFSTVTLNNVSHKIYSVKLEKDRLVGTVRTNATAVGRFLSDNIDDFVFRPRSIGDVDEAGRVILSEIITFDAIPVNDDSFDLNEKPEKLDPAGKQAQLKFLKAKAVDNSRIADVLDIPMKVTYIRESMDYSAHNKLFGFLEILPEINASGNDIDELCANLSKNLEIFLKDKNTLEKSLVSSIGTNEYRSVREFFSKKDDNADEKLTSEAMESLGKCLAEYNSSPSKGPSKTDRDMLKEANELLRSCYNIAKRKGNDTSWDLIMSRLDAILEDQWKVLYDSNVEFIQPALTYLNKE